jgi:hypothetical protein
MRVHFRSLDHESSATFEYLPRRFVRRIQERKKLSCSCGQYIVTAPGQALVNAVSGFRSVIRIKHDRINDHDLTPLGVRKAEVAKPVHDAPHGEIIRHRCTRELALRHTAVHADDKFCRDQPPQACGATHAGFVTQAKDAKVRSNNRLDPLGSQPSIASVVLARARRLRACVGNRCPDGTSRVWLRVEPQSGMFVCFLGGLLSCLSLRSSRLRCNRARNVRVIRSFRENAWSF